LVVLSQMGVGWALLVLVLVLVLQEGGWLLVG
jgi:hypothetical protein